MISSFDVWCLITSIECESWVRIVTIEVVTILTGRRIGPRLTIDSTFDSTQRPSPRRYSAINIGYKVIGVNDTRYIVVNGEQGWQVAGPFSASSLKDIPKTNIFNTKGGATKCCYRRNYYAKSYR